MVVPHLLLAAGLVGLTSFVEKSVASSIQLLPRDSKTFDYDHQKVRGVNIGGWLLTEPYINLSLYRQFGDSNAPVDEYHLCEKLGKQECRRQLEAHWKSWFQESDVKAIASNYNLNTIRIPIGYWAFLARKEDPYVQGQVEYLDQALEWARNAGLYVWIDLHGVPGSQNGFDNSGKRDKIEFQQGQNQNQTLEVLGMMAKKYGDAKYNDVVSGLQLVNEPLGPAMDMNVLKQFYKDAYQRVRATGMTNKIVLHDAFQALHYWDSEFGIPDYWNIVIDHHHYQMFSPWEVHRSIDQQVDVACEYGQQFRNENKWKVVGEWSAALTDCAMYLNGVGRGARYDGTLGNDSHFIGSCQNRWDFFQWSDQDKVNTRRFVEAQLDAFELAGGWIFWCYKTENALEWDFRRLVDYGLFPYPWDSRKYPNQCQY